MLEKSFVSKHRVDICMRVCQCIHFLLRTVVLITTCIYHDCHMNLSSWLHAFITMCNVNNMLVYSLVFLLIHVLYMCTQTFDDECAQ